MFAEHILHYGWTGAILALWVALAVGSFLNVVIYRLPVMLERQWQDQARDVLEQRRDEPAEPFNLLLPRSRCPSCNATIGAWQNVPVISWILLRGRCRQCSTPISIRYPAVELLTAACSTWILGTYGFSWLGLAALLFTWALIALTFIDYDTQLLPDQITLPLLWLGLICNLQGGFTDLHSAVAGAIAGYLLLWSVYWGFKLITHKEGMGYGDFKLLGAIGAWFGWQVLPTTILIASMAGLVYALIITVAGKRQSAQPIPFGPFLAIAGWVWLAARDNVPVLFQVY